MRNRTSPSIAAPGAPANGVAQPGTRDRILECATSLFGKRGYYGTSLRDIASAAGVRQGLTYYYFESKEALVYEIIRGAAVRHLEDVGAIAERGGDGLTKLTAVARLRVYNAVYESVWDVTRLVDYENVLTPEHLVEYRGLLRQNLDLIESFMAEAVRDGQADPRHPHTIVELLLNMGDGVRKWYRPQGSLTLDQLQDLVAELFLKAITPTH